MAVSFGDLFAVSVGDLFEDLSAVLFGDLFAVSFAVLFGDSFDFSATFKIHHAKIDPFGCEALVTLNFWFYINKLYILEMFLLF